MDHRHPRPLALIILDGWGYSDRKEGNAIALAHKPFWDWANQNYPHTLISAAAERVGLPRGQMGNSEVGHLNIGAGRIIRMDITRIDDAIEDGSFGRTVALTRAVNHAKTNSGKLHLLGLISDGGVHSHQNHLYAILALAKTHSLQEVFVHCLLDGRDTPPRSGRDYVARLMDKISEIGAGQVASVCGRYYGMDRDKRWERIERAYHLLVHGQGDVSAADPIEAIECSYQQGVTDEFVKPSVITNQLGRPRAIISDGDSVLCFNFRADRVRELTQALALDDFDGFPRPGRPPILYTCMTQYDARFGLPVAFPPETYPNILAQVFAERGIRNLRIAETEKYAHVTYFFNGGVEKVYPAERRLLVPSPKVATYDLMPEMSAFHVTDEACKAIAQGESDVLIINFANADMVGHTGILPAAVEAIETLDQSLGRIIEALRNTGGAAIISADHGNAEQMIDYDTGQPHTAHTTNPVPFILIDDQFKGSLRRDASLRDIAPTMLGILGIPKPPEMTGVDIRISR